jgi:acyl-homoserine-lactone acylase
MFARRFRTVLALGAPVLAVPLLVTAPPAAAGQTLHGGGYRALIVRASYGVPHITALSFGSLGFGAGYAQAEDNICVIAERILTVDAGRARHLGATQSNIASDLFFQKAKDGRVAERFVAGRPDGVHAPSRRARDLVRGFVAGYNERLRRIGRDRITDPACRGKSWVRPVTETEAWRDVWASMIRGGEAALLDAIVAAAPPSPGAATATTQSATTRSATTPSGTTLRRTAAALGERLRDAGGVGSNAYALGRDATANRGGMLLANPHFPWDGPDRFYRMHLTVPGVYDAEGAALIGDPIVEIGHNGRVAWSHTVSTAQRFVIHRLPLVPGDPTAYVTDGVVRRMTARTVTVQAAAPGGGTTAVTRTLYDTHHGPVVVLPGLLAWTATEAYAITDANSTNNRALDGWLELGRARDVQGMRAVLDRHQFLPWVNVIAADAGGRAMYGDHSVVPRVTDELADACIPAPLRPVYEAEGIAILDGSRSACGLGADPDAAVPGILGPSRLPVLVRTDYVTNSNDSYWLANPAAPLAGFSRILGDEGTPRSLRTRLGLVQVEERLAGTDGLPGRRFTPSRLWDVLFGNRVYGGELVRDDLVRMCEATPSATATDGTAVDLRPACAALRGWDLRADTRSRGTHLFREFVRAGGLRFADAFDPADPVRTPNRLATTDPAVLRALADAVRRLAGVPLDAPLGAVQTEPRGDSRIPIHGDIDGTGTFNVITAGLVPGVGYPKIRHGASYVLAVQLGRGGPSGRQILTYSQSTDPTSRHSGDQTRLYSREGWDGVKFTWAQLAADRHTRAYVVRGR